MGVNRNQTDGFKEKQGEKAAEQKGSDPQGNTKGSSGEETGTAGGSERSDSGDAATDQQAAGSGA